MSKRLPRRAVHSPMKSDSRTRPSPDMRVQRTRSSASAHRAPLTRGPLGKLFRSSPRKAVRVKTIVATIVLILSRVAARAETSSEYLAVFGAGESGSWGTEFAISSTVSFPSQVLLSFAPDQICPPLISCHTIADLGSRASISLPAPFGGGVGVAYVASLGSTSLPALAARAQDRSGRSVDLPAFKLSALLALNLDALVLPGAIAGQAERSNLLVANLGEIGQYDGDSVVLRVEVIDAIGNTLASRELPLDFRNTKFLADVVRWAGAGDLDQGQLLLTRIGGAGKFWAIMPVVHADGSVSISNGVIP